MTKNISITVLPGEERDEKLIRKKAAAVLSVRPEEISALIFRKKSIDARKGQVKLCLSYTAWVGENPPEGDGSGATGSSFAPSWKKADPARRVIIVGSGPAGLFAALRLLEDGITPVIVERGVETAERKRDIAQISREQKVNSESNYCFGEGGAGTFSDGKLYSRSNKRGDIGRILAIFRHHGASEEILTDAHPHIGTDKLPLIINAMRETILSFGGEFRFGTRCTGLVIEGGRVTGIRAVKTGGDGAQAAAGSALGAAGSAQGVAESAQGAGETVLKADAVILAAGHSARDIYDMLSEIEKSGLAGTVPLLEPKTFAVGVRVEHPRELIDKIQYHGRERDENLPAATYRLAAQVEDRGVYSFCMCPGGLIVPSATSDDEIVVNGMSPSSRNSRWSNAAIVVETRPEDIPAEFRKEGDVLAGLRFQKWLEQEAKRHGDGQKAPAQRLVDFVEGRESATLPDCSYSPGIVPSRLDRWLPARIAERLQEGFVEFNKFMKGFISPDAVVVGVETRTSSPVRIVRDGETLESAGIAGLYPAGEGSGYAGGIVSSAMDGERCAEAIVRKLSC